MSFHRGDNFSAFGHRPIEIELENPWNVEVSKVEFVCGKIIKPYADPTFPLLVTFNEEESRHLRVSLNDAYLIAYDKDGQKWTCDGCLPFRVLKEVDSER